MMNHDERQRQDAVAQEPALTARENLGHHSDQMRPGCDYWGEYRRLVCPVSGSQNIFSITSLPFGHYFPKVWELCTDYFSHH